VKGELADEIAQALSPTSAYKHPKVCQAFASKKRYVLARLEGLSEEELLELTEKVVAQHPDCHDSGWII
jgi:hypothetical protein